MTALTPNDRFVSLSPAAGTTVLAYDFQLLLDVGMTVQRIRAGVLATLALGVDYSFPGGIGNEAGGTLTLAVASLAGDVYQLIGAQPEQRLSDFLASQKFDSAKMNADLDALTIVTQEHRRDIERSWKSAYGTAGGQISIGGDGDIAVGDGAGNIKASGTTIAGLLSSVSAYAIAAAASATAAAASASAASTSATSAGNSATAASASASAAAVSAAAAATSAASIAIVANRTALKALPVVAGAVARLNQAGRAGYFQAVNAAIPYSDPQEGVYVASNTAGWYWERIAYRLNPGMFGGSGSLSSDVTVDSGAAINAMIAFIKQTYSFAVGGFLYAASTEGRWYKSTISIDATNFQQPSFRIEDFKLASYANGKIALDLAGCNVVTIDGLEICGDAASMPSVLLYCGRAKPGGVLNAAPNLVIAKSYLHGYASKASYVQFAAEVSSVQMTIINQSKSLTAYGYVNAGHWGTIDDYLGGLTSDYTTLPSAADGSQSNVLHHVDIPNVTRGSVYYLAITSISKANPAVVTCNSAALIASGIANGDKIFLGEVAGMTELAPGTTNPSGVYTVANINTGAGTFELSGINSTGYGTFTSGHVRNQTGPAVLLNGCASLTWDNFYSLAYGNFGVILDNKNGIAMRDVALGFQHEPTGLSPMRIDHPATAVEQEIPGLEIDFLNQFQQWTDCIISSNAASGWTKLTRGKLNIRMLTGTVPPNKIFGTPGKFNLNGFDIQAPVSTVAQDFTATPTWGGGSTPNVTFSASDDPRMRAYGNFWQAVGDAPRVSTNRPFNSGALGVYDFVGLNSAGAEVIYGFMRGRIVVNTAGGEYGREEFVYKVNGVDTIAYFIQGQLLQLQAASLGLMTGTASQAPLVWAAGVNKTTVAAGEWEFDGKAFYAAAVAASRQVITTKQIATVQGSTVALSNSSTSAQNIFAAANDVLTVAAATTYRFRARLAFNTGATSHTTAFGFGGTATFTACDYTSLAMSSAAGTLATPQMLRVASAAATVLTAASTAVTTDIMIEGIIRVNAAGTIIPQVTFSAGPTGTCETAIDSFFELEPIGSNTVAAVGNWG